MASEYSLLVEGIFGLLVTACHVGLSEASKNSPRHDLHESQLRKGLAYLCTSYWRHAQSRLWLIESSLVQGTVFNRVLGSTDKFQHSRLSVAVSETLVPL